MGTQLGDGTGSPELLLPSTHTDTHTRTHPGKLPSPERAAGTPSGTVPRLYLLLRPLHRARNASETVWRGAGVNSELESRGTCLMFFCLLVLGFFFFFFFFFLFF